MYIWLAVILAVILAVALYLYGTWNHKYFTRNNLPNSKPLPIFGNMAPIVCGTISTAEHVRNIYNEFRGHKMVGFFEFTTPLVMLKDPDLIKQIAVKDFDYFMDHRIPFKEESDPLFGKNLFSLKGDRWKHMRSTLSPAFTSSKMKAMFLLMEQCGRQMTNHLIIQCKGAPDGLLSLNIKDFYTRFTNDVIATTAFGIHCDSLQNPDNEFYRTSKELANFGGIRSIKFLFFRLCPKLMQILGFTVFSKKMSSFFRSLIHGTIAAREREGIVRPDMIHLMMQARRGTLRGDTDDVTQPQDGKKIVLSDDDITANALLFFLAGFDTSSTVLSFTSLLLATHPDIQRRAQEEVDAVLKQDDGKFTYDGVQRMKYLDMVISETLRLFPPAPTTDRKCVRPYVIAATDTSPSIKMKVGDGIWIPQYAIQRDPEYFHDPERFDPERFSDENKHNINPFTYMPFGVGPRNCIGLRFAQMELKIALSSILSRFSLEVVKQTPTKIRLSTKSFPMTPVGGFWVGIKHRDDVL